MPEVKRFVPRDNVTKLPPPAKQVEQTLADKLGAEDGRVLHMLIEAREGRGFARGGLAGFILGAMLAGGFVLYTTTALMDPVAKVAISGDLARRVADGQMGR